MIRGVSKNKPVEMCTGNLSKDTLLSYSKIPSFLWWGSHHTIPSNQQQQHLHSKRHQVSVLAVIEEEFMNDFWFVWSGAWLFFCYFISRRLLLLQQTWITSVMQSLHRCWLDVPLLKQEEKNLFDGVGAGGSCFPASSGKNDITVVKKRKKKGTADKTFNRSILMWFPSEVWGFHMLFISYTV